MAAMATITTATIAISITTMPVPMITTASSAAGTAVETATSTTYIENPKFEKFFADTGIEIEAGCGIDTTDHRDAWRQVSITTEIACCEFTQPVKAQGRLFDLLRGAA